MADLQLGVNDVRQVRLASSLLRGGAHTAADVAEHFFALQGQDWAAARLALGVRVPGSTRASIDAEFNEGRLVRSWPMRGTLHVVAARDLGWVQALTNARAMQDAPRRRRLIGLELATIERVEGIVRDTLSGGRALTRDELLGAVAAAGVTLVAQQRYHTIWHLAQTGVLTFGPVRGGRHLLVLADDWIRQPRWFDSDAALAELFRMYVRGHGPCSVADFSWWTKLSVTVSKRAAVLAADVYGDELVAVDIDGLENWATAAALDAVRAKPHGGAEPLLLPGFDELYLGLRDRSAHIDPELAALLAPGSNGVFRASVLVNGQIVGTWKALGKGASVTPQIELFRDILVTPDLEAATERYRHYLGS